MENEGSQGTPYQLFMLALCVVVLLVLAAEAITSPGREVSQILLAFDTIAALIFLGDFFHSLYRAENRLRYFLTWGWLDLLSSIPSVLALRWGRAARVARLLRVLRGVRSIRLLGAIVLRQRSQSAFLSAVLVVMLTIFFGSIAILVVEAPAGGNILTASDALWWTVVTISTAGFGDYYLVTVEGRAIAAGIMFVGIALFGTITALFAVWLLKPEEEEQEAALALLADEIRQMRGGVGDQARR